MAEPVQSDVDLSGARVLLTGASGFIGPHLLERLSARGAEIHAVSRSERSSPPSVRWWSGNPSDFDRMARVLREVRPEFVFHLAGAVTGSRELSAVRTTLEGNLLSAVNLLELAVELGCRRLLLTGSLEEPEPGDSEPTPGSPYAAAKWAASAYGRMFHALYDAPVTHVRVFMVYGPGPQNEQRIIPYVIRCLQRREAPRLSSGARAVDWVYVEDVAEGFVRCATAADALGRTVDLGSGTLVTIRELVEELVSMVPEAVEPEFGALPDRPLERVCRADVKRTRQILGWSPPTDLREGLRRTLAWYASQGGTDAAPR